MHIVIDLQFCQHPDVDAQLLLDTLAQVRELAQQAGSHVVSIALNARFPARIAVCRTAVAGAVPPERILVYAAPASDGTARTARIIELIHENFFRTFDADLVFTPTCVGNAATADGWHRHAGPPRVVGVASLGALDSTTIRDTLRHAAVLLASTPQVSARLHACLGAAAPTVVDIGTSPAHAASVAWAAFERLAALRAPPAAGATRPRLAWVAPAPPGAGGAMALLLGELTQFYDVELIVNEPDAGVAPLRDMAWFDAHAGQFERVLYHIGNAARYRPVLSLLERHPGVVVLHDFAIGSVLDQMESNGAVPQGLTRALFVSHGYSGLSEYRRNGHSATVSKFPSNKLVLDHALGIIAGAESMRALARQWYGPHIGTQWRIVDLSANAHQAGAARLYHDAIEAFSCRSAAAHYRQLLSDLAQSGAPADPRDRLLIAAAKAIAGNQPPKGARQLLVDISAVAAADLKTGIQRVVRSILLALINDPPEGFRIEPVYGNGGNRRYRYARRFTLDLIGQPGILAEDEAVEHQPGDIFLGLDLAANSTVGNLALLNEMRDRGIAMYFVVYDVLPLLQPHAFPFGTEHYFGEYIQSIVQHADGLLCISRAVADELTDWIGTHAPRRPRPVKIAHFHLGADLDASAPSTGMPEHAEQVLTGMRARPSILMVGTLEPRKCHAQALAAFDILWQRGVDVNLVIVGKQGWMVDPLADALRAHSQRGEMLFWLPGVSDEMLTEVYRLATALLAASTGEGFGLPLIEAAQHGLPIIARALPVFREVSGEHAYYFEGNDPVQLADAVQAWLHLFHQGQAPASAAMPWLSWSESAQQLLGSIIDDNWYRTLPV